MFRWLFRKKPPPQPKYPREWNQRVPAEVFACLIPGEIVVILHPGNPGVDGGARIDVLLDRIPLELRMPNQRLWVELDESLNVVRAWRREEE